MKASPVNKFAALLLLAGICHAGPSREERALVAFYIKHYPRHVQPQWLREVARETAKWSARACLSSQTDTILSMIHRESGFNPTLTGDDGRSYGLCQTLREYEPRLRAFWLGRGYKLGGFDEMETQVAFGVAEFYGKLKDVDGRVWAGVRRYNGGGHKAMRYARNVMVSRKVIFKRPYRVVEKIKICS